ncbi:hypothetical protein SAMN05661091_0699 [Paenibacillus uliginis N3/975]|uniref:Uncharacterized protein n=1 Tax=Paenibacillus uliginis N3/975 TaxID=1313296 RepID=A0A1X7GKL2_9BACL|nr:YxlC family protein [Paenibacillus uliginis]SMF71232.1 hypothetical protein SAMN05661091_0699 [Paenibacillus uliginis N3/975]
MSKIPDQEDEQFIANLKVELNRMDSAFDEPTPSLADFNELAVHTLANQKRRWRKEFFIFLLVALFIVSAIFVAAWWDPVVLLLIHGSSMLIGAVILTVSLTSRGSRDFHE